MALAQCTPAHGKELTIENDKSIEIINKQTTPQSDGLGYSAITHKSSEFGLVTNNSQSAQPRHNAVFLCVSFSTFAMVRLDGDTFACASDFESLLTNPIQSNLPRLVTSGSTSLILKGVTNHAI